MFKTKFIPWRTLERDLLGISHATPEQTARSVGWRRDDPDLYCHRCGSTAGEGEVTTSGCGMCRSSRLPWAACVRLGAYRSHLAEWVKQIKFDRWQDMGRFLGIELANAIRERDGWDLAQSAVVPMPMPWLRQHLRGIDHARVIADHLAEQLGLPLVTPLKRRNGPTQFGLTITERKRFGGRGIRPRRSHRYWGCDVNGWDVILVDDVATTGTSLRRASRQLRKLGVANVSVAVVCIGGGGKLQQK